MIETWITLRINMGECVYCETSYSVHQKYLEKLKSHLSKVIPNFPVRSVHASNLSYSTQIPRDIVAEVKVLQPSGKECSQRVHRCADTSR